LLRRPPLNTFQLLSPRPGCARRRRALWPLASDIMRGRGEGQPLTLTAWLSLFLLCVFLAQAPAALTAVSSLALFLGLCLIALFDARYLLIPDGPLVFLLLAGLATCLATAPHEIGARLTAAALGFAALRFVAAAYEAVRGSPGVGEGDARLFAAAGLWLGFAGLPSCLIYGVLSALVAAVVGLRQGLLEDARAPLPFGPHLAFGLWLCWTIGPLEFG
jgi:leader peptidase (prepilin peptidase) / N-methyltransferase